MFLKIQDQDKSCTVGNTTPDDTTGPLGPNRYLQAGFPVTRRVAIPNDNFFPKALDEILPPPPTIVDTDNARLAMETSVIQHQSKGMWYLMSPTVYTQYLIHAEGNHH